MVRLASSTNYTVLRNKVDEVLCKRREENQVDSTENLIALIICSTCFGQLYAHHQELETILVLLLHMVCNAARMQRYN